MAPCVWHQVHGTLRLAHGTLHLAAGTLACANPTHDIGNWLLKRLRELRLQLKATLLKAGMGAEKAEW